MNSAYLTPEEVAGELKLSRYTIYEMIKRGKLPACKVGRALRISRADLDAYLHGQYQREDQIPPYITPAERQNRPGTSEIYFAGSHDPVIDLVGRLLAKRGITLLPAFSGSLDGLIELYKGRVEMAGCHLLDKSTGEYNLPYIRCLQPSEGVVVVNLVGRWQGFIVPRNNPRMITSWEEFFSGRHRIVNRQRGSGTRILLDFRLQQLGVSPASVPGYDQEVTNHYAAASAVLRGAADAALGIESVVRGLPLDFYPIQAERYDLVIPAPLLEQDRFQILLEVLQDPRFKQEVVAQGGYDVSQTGKTLDKWK